LGQKTGLRHAQLLLWLMVHRRFDRRSIFYKEPDLIYGNSKRPSQRHGDQLQR
jgi:hypothetical protein